MKEKIIHIITKWRFWLGFQLLLIFILNIIGHVRVKNTLNQILHSDGEPFLGFLGATLGFPSGISFFFSYNIHNTWLNGIFIAYIIPAIYYPIFFFLIWYITKQKKNWKLMAFGLILFMILSFAGCSRVIEIPLTYT